MKQGVARLEGEKTILHSDQGWQHQMVGYQAILRENGIQQSMSRKGSCLDNCAMGSFFGRLKPNVITASGLKRSNNWRIRFTSTFIITTMSVFKLN